jgi:hypothetical protein
VTQEPIRTPTKQKYVIIYQGKLGLCYEVLSYKGDVRKCLKVINREDIRFIVKGRPLNIRTEERLTV